VQRPDQLLFCFFAFLAARFSFRVFSGFFLMSFFVSLPLVVTV
jgi:hypothetical protein